MVSKRRSARSIRNARSHRASPTAVLRKIEPSAGASVSRIRRDVAHGVLMFAALFVAYALPFELFVLAYAILGPAHYLTEISWLHDRKYFLPSRYIALVLCLVALGAMFLADTFWLGIVVSVAFVACVVLAAALPFARTLALLALTAAIFAVLALLHVPFGIAWLLIPTLIHVSLFTLIFMLVGAFKSRSAAQFALVCLYVAAVVAILVFPPTGETVLPDLARIGKNYFGDIAPAIGTLIGIPNVAFDARITGLLSFVYTYHYLNWFIKVDVIRWAAVPKARMAAIVLLSVGATALYFYNYVYGFMVLILLSLTHVLLEFPLNSISIRELGAIASRRLRGARNAT